MSRKAELRKEYRAILNRVREGRHATKIIRAQELERILNDLYHLPQVPVSFSNLSQKDIQSLVLYWKTKGKSASTIINKLANLRFLAKHLKLRDPIPSNKALDLRKQTYYRSDKAIDFVQIHTNIENSIARAIFGMVLYFGMTFSEVVNCIPLYHIDHLRISITRDIAFNGKEREIPIFSKEQEKALEDIKEFLKGDELLSLSKRWPYNVLLKLYHAELAIQQLPHLNYRDHYACFRYHQLISNKDDLDPIEKLKKEMGVGSSDQIRHYLRSNRLAINQNRYS